MLASPVRENISLKIFCINFMQMCFHPNSFGNPSSLGGKMSSRHLGRTEKKATSLKCMNVFCA